LIQQGQITAALTVADEGIELARKREAKFELLCLLTEPCRILLGPGSEGKPEDTDSILAECDVLVEKTGAAVFAPQVRELRALRVDSTLDAATRLELDEAFASVGADGQANRLSPDSII
jgi:hypothetical protein